MNNELLGHDAIVAEFLENSRTWLKGRSFEGDQASDYTTKWEWMIAMITAIGIINESITRIYLEGEKYDA